MKSCKIYNLYFLCLCIREAAVEFEEDSGIEGILNRLEYERILSLGITTGKYGYGSNCSSRNSLDGGSSGTTTTGRVFSPHFSLPNKPVLICFVTVLNAV